MRSFLRHVFSIGKIDDSRLQWIDLAKGLAIAMIVYRHTITGIWDAGIPMDFLYYDISVQVGLTFRMPLYFMLSGIFFRRSVQKRGPLGYTMHKVNTIMYPYFVWSIILMTLQMIFSNYVNGQFTTLSDWATMFYDPWGHWWFLYVLFVVSVLYMSLDHVLKGNKQLILLICVVLFFLSYWIGDIYLLDDILELIVFFALGDVVASFAIKLEESTLLTNKIALAGIFALAITGEYLLFQYFRDSPLPILVFACVGISAAAMLCALFAKSKTKAKRILRLLGQHSLYIYLLHAFAAPAMRVLLNRVFGIEELYILVPLCFISGVLVPILVYRAITYFGGSFLFALNYPRS